jgi:rhodanese-related sulfurtransferase
MSARVAAEGSDDSMGGVSRGRSCRTAEQLLDEARGRLERLCPRRAQAAARTGAVLIDIRSEAQRERDGVIPGSRFVARNVLEWRCDPASHWRDPAVTDAGAQVIVICNEGYQSSLAAATLQQLGLADATDVIGGFQAWRAAGLPVLPITTGCARQAIGDARGRPPQGDEQRSVKARERLVRDHRVVK